jgi:hypothetical protein
MPNKQDDREVVLTRIPDARLLGSTGEYRVISDTVGDHLGHGRTPLRAWANARLWADARSRLPQSAPAPPLDKEKSCCTVCDARKKCHVCGQQTLYACSDCRIDFGVTVYVCNKKECRDAHEQKCPAALLRTIAQLQGLNVAQSKIILGMQKRNDSLQQVDSFYQQHQVDTEKISELGKLVDDACTKGEEVCRQRDDLQQQLAQIREVKGERP